MVQLNFTQAFAGDRVIEIILFRIAHERHEMTRTAFFSVLFRVFRGKYIFFKMMRIAIFFDHHLTNSGFNHFVYR